MSEILIPLLFLGALAGCGLLALIWPDPVRGLYAAICASAVLITPHLPIVREKVSACEVVIVLTWAAMLAQWPGRSSAVPRLLPLQKRAIYWGAGLILACGLSMGVGLIRENVLPIPSVVETVNYFYGFLLFLTVVHLVTSFRTWVNCCYAWAAGTAIACSVGLFSLATGGPAWTRDEFTGRLAATFKFANQLSSYCLPILAFVLVAAGWKSTKPRVSLFLFGLAGAIVACVVATGSRIAFGMVVLMLIAVGWLAMRGTNRALFRTSLMRWMGAGLVGGFGWFVISVATQDDLSYKLGYTPAAERPIRMMFQRFRKPGSQLAEGNRADQLDVVLSNVYQRPLFGTGPHNFPIIFRMSEIHNTYAGVLAEEGILGFVALIAFFASAAYCGWYGLKRSRHGAQYLTILSVLIGFGTLLVYGLAMYGLRQRPIWLMTGLMVALPRVLYTDHLTTMRVLAARRRERERPSDVPVIVGEN